MPILNQKLLLRLFAAAAVLGGGLVVLHHVQAGRVPEALLWQADTAVEKGRPDKAISYLKQYLEFRPDDHDTAVRLADMMLARGAAKDHQNALFLFERVLREAPQRADVARKLVALCIQLRRYADAYGHAQKLLETNRTDGVVHAQVAQCLVAQGRPDEARPAYEQALALAPEHVRAYEEYADLLERHFKKPQDAGAVLDRLAKANPNRPEAFLARARFLRRTDRADECLRSLERVFLLDPENGEALVLSAEVLQSKGELRRAREALTDAVTMYPRYVHGYRALSWLELLSGNEADALTTLERGVAALPDAPDLLTPLADLWIERGNLDRGRAVVAKLETLQAAAPAEGRRPFALRASYLRGRLLMKDGRWNEALTELEALRTEALGMPGLASQLNLLLAACHERRADRDAQVEALRRVLTAEPNHLGARVALANALLNAGRLEDALKEYQAAAKSPLAGLGVQLACAGLRLSWARLSEAADDEWKAIGASVMRLREEHKGAIEPVTLHAEWLAGRGDFTAAEKVLRAEADARPGDPRVWSALGGILGRGRGTLAAAEAISRGQVAAGDAIELRLARARVWADDAQPGRGRRLARLEDLPPTATDAERTRLLTGLAELYAAVRDDAGRVRVLTELAARNGQDVECRKALYGLALKGGEPATRARWCDELRRVEGPTGRSVALAEALHEVRTGAVVPDRKLAEWHDLAHGVIATTPDEAQAYVLLGLVAEARKDSTAAAKHFEAAADLDPTAAGCQEARLAHYLRAGQDEAARRTLVRLESDPRLSGQRFRSTVEAALEQGGPDGLGKCLGWLAAHLKREPRSAVWAGRLLEARGKLADAQALYKQVTESYPAFADGWSARLLASAKLGEPEVAETMRLATGALERQAFFAVCAECGAAVRAKVPTWAPPVTTAEDRRAYAEACIAACEARGRLEDAVPVLTAIADDKESRPEDAAWARRTVAALTAALGTPDQKERAVRSLDNGDRPKSLADARSRVAALTVVLRTVSGDDRRALARELIGLLTEITRDSSATSNDWYQLAQLHGLAGDRAAARRCLVELVNREPKNLFYLALAVDDLLSDGKLTEARPLASRLGEGVRDVRVLGAAARFHTLANEPDAVLTFVDRYVRAADAGTTDAAVRQREAANLLDQLTRIAAARGLSAAGPLLAAAGERYRASLRAFPEAVAPMAALLAFAGQAEPAFDVLERFKARLSPPALAAAGLAVLRAGHASPRQFQMVRGWIEAALGTDPDSVPLKLALGELLALQPNFPAADAVFRDVLKAVPDNVFALNNLAWILAPRPEAADEALRFIDRAIALAGASAEMLDTRARILISAGRYDRALSDLSDAIGPGGSPLRHFHLALAYSKMGKTDDAVKAFRDGRARGLTERMIHPEDMPVFVTLSGQAK